MSTIGPSTSGPSADDGEVTMTDTGRGPNVDPDEINDVADDGRIRVYFTLGYI